MNLTDQLMRTICNPGGQAIARDVVRQIAKRKHHPADVLAQLMANYNVRDGILIGWQLK